jgi:hypothetical protein
VEGSVCNAYLVEESSTFFSYYFESHVQTRHTYIARNEEFTTDHSGDEQLLSVCNARGKALGSIQTRFLTSEELKVATNYILLNFEEVQPYIQQFSNDLCSHTPGILELEIKRRIENGFAGWFKEYVSYLSFICSSNMFTDKFHTNVTYLDRSPRPLIRTGE